MKICDRCHSPSLAEDPVRTYTFPIFLIDGKPALEVNQEFEFHHYCMIETAGPLYECFCDLGFSVRD